MTAPCVHEESVRAEPVEALRGHFDRLSANGYGRVATDGLRRVAIDPISRVEGHGKVTLLLDAAGRVQQARLHIVEFRGFERFIVGRPYWEVPVVVQRLCGICPVSHHLAACKALDVALGVAAQVPPSAQALRRLALALVAETWFGSEAGLEIEAALGTETAPSLLVVSRTKKPQ